MAKGILKRHLKQDICWWSRTGNDGFGGNTYDEAVQIKGRWEDKHEKYIDTNGEERISKSVVTLNSDVKLGDFLFLGSISDLPSDTDNPHDSEISKQTYEIMAIDKIPTLGAEENKIKVWL